MRMQGRPWRATRRTKTDDSSNVQVFDPARFIAPNPIRRWPSASHWHGHCIKDFEVEMGSKKMNPSNLETHTSGLDVLIVYDSVRSGKRAKELCDRLGQQLAPDCELNFSVWSLSALQLPTLVQAAASAAERAALLIVAVNGDRTL